MRGRGCGGRSRASGRSGVSLPLVLLESCNGAERQQWDDLSSIMNSVVLSSSKDRWTCDLSGDGEFKVKVIRNFIDDLFLPSSDVATRWVKFIPIKVNVISWRARRDSMLFFRCDVDGCSSLKFVVGGDLDGRRLFFSDWMLGLSFRLSYRLKSILGRCFLCAFGWQNLEAFEISWSLTLRLLMFELLITLFLVTFYGVLVDVIGFFLGSIG
ncbi:hypothetical protein Tco_1291931 [Tanacetum coccineum]